jgi:uncharacterized protein with PIN domain
MSKTAKKAWKTREQKKLGRRVAEHRRQIMVQVKDLLKKWDKEMKGKEICVVCGDNLPKTILQRHHLDPRNKKSEETIWLCASCHNIFNKIKESTTLDEVKRDLNLRHERFLKSSS